MAVPALITVARFIAGSGVAAAIKKYGKKAVDAAKLEFKDIVTKRTKGQEQIAPATQGQRVYREGRRKGAAVGAGVGAGVAAALSSDDKKKDKTPKGVRYNKVTDADVARVRAKTQEAKARQSGPATVTVKKGDTLSEIAKANDMSVAQIKAINDIKNVNEIKPGQKIKLKTKDPYENKMSKGGKATKKKK